MPSQLNTSGIDHAERLIGAGSVTSTARWSFGSQDGNKLLGDESTDFKTYGWMHLAVDPEQPNETKTYWRYPFGKILNGTMTVYRSALVAARQRSGQQGETEVFETAGRLLNMVDKNVKKNSKVLPKAEIEIDNSKALALAMLGFQVKENVKDETPHDEIRKEFKIEKVHAEQQIVYGVILEEGETNPDGLFTDDLAGDFVLAEDVEKASMRYMQKGKLTIKYHHKDEIPVNLIENLVVRPGDRYNGIEFTKTAWIAGVHIPSKDMWSEIKAGKLNSFSMGGFGLRKEI